MDRQTLGTQESALLQKHARGLIYLGGIAVAAIVVLLMMFRSYEGRPQTLNDDGRTVKQSKVDCPPARTALTQSFNKADPSVPSNVRICVERGRAKAFVTGLMLLFVGIATWGASYFPDPRPRRRAGKEGSEWDSAIARANESRDRHTGVNR